MNGLMERRGGGFFYPFFGFACYGVIHNVVAAVTQG